MPERTTQRTARGDDDASTSAETTDTGQKSWELAERELDGGGVDDRFANDPPVDSPTASAGGGRLERLFSVKRFVAGLLLVAVGSVVAGGVVPVAGPLVGIFLAAFLFGLASSTRPVTEAGVAGALVAGVTAIVGDLVFAMLGFGLPLAVVTAILGAVAGGFGAYFGSDLRDGLTRDLET